MATVSAAPLVGQAVAAVPVTVSAPPLVGQAVPAAAVTVSAPPLVGQAVPAAVVTATAAPLIGRAVAAVGPAGFYKVLNGKVVRPFLYHISGGRVVSLADDAVAVTNPPVVTVQNKLGWVGDSLSVAGITNGLVPLVNALGFDGTITSNNGTRAIVGGTNIRMDALVGRSISAIVSPFPTPGTLEVVAGIRSAIHPNLWVFPLSSNDFDQGKTGFKARVNAVLDLVDDEPTTRILWVGPIVRPTPSNTALQPSINTVMYPGLNEVAAERASVLDMRVFDLQAAIRNQGLDESNPQLWSDDRHMTAAGYTLRNQLIVAVMRTLGFTALPTITERLFTVPLTTAGHSEVTETKVTEGRTAIKWDVVSDQPFTASIETSADGSSGWTTAGALESSNVVGLSSVATVTRTVFSPYVRCVVLCGASPMTRLTADLTMGA